MTLSSLYDLLCAGVLPLATGAGWEGVDVMAARRGAAVRSYHPHEGDHGWVDSWCLLRDAPNPDAAYAWVDCMIGAEAQTIVCDRIPCGTVNREAAGRVGADVRRLFPVESVDRVFASATDLDLPPLEACGDIATFDDWRAAWECVRSG